MNYPSWTPLDNSDSCPQDMVDADPGRVQPVGIHHDPVKIYGATTLAPPSQRPTGCGSDACRHYVCASREWEKDHLFSSKNACLSADSTFDSP